MKLNEMLLTLLQEECNEVAQRATKAVRFGINEIQAGQNDTNGERIIYEFNDLVAVMELLKGHGLITDFYDRQAVQAKKQKIAQWLNYSRECGTLED